MYEDSKKAMELDPCYFKGFLRHGEACIELGKHQKHQNLKIIDEGISHLQKALYLCWKQDIYDDNQKRSFEKQIGK